MKTEMDDRLESGKIAIVGMGGRFPGANDLETFWKNLKEGVESITHFTDAELLSALVNTESLRQPNYVKAKPMLDGVELFDAGFFGFSPKEAACMDPQNRLFMECVWEAIENAGYDAGRYDGAISLYGGARISSYLLNNLYKNSEAMALGGEFQTLIFNNPGFLTTAIAHRLNLKGPCYTIETFCSTSLVAVHVACQSLLNFECDMAVAGGVAITVPQKAGYWYHEGSIVSPDGHCRPFDARANGTVFGNGVGAVVLKRMEDALRDRDHIEAVIIGSATNNDGSLKVSYAAPSVAGQAEVIVEALANSGVDPETISYVEAHGTGTVLGDPAEIAALTQAFRTGTQKKGFCCLGSVKANIGHLDTAAGIAGLIKTVLALKYCAIPPNFHFSRANPDIDFENTPFYVNKRLLEWKSDGAPRRAGISSFGVGGTNAHVIVEEAPEGMPSGSSKPMQILSLSARTESAVDAATRNLSNYLRENQDMKVADVAYTLSTGRKAFSHRRYLVCTDVKDAVQALETLNPRLVKSRHIESRDPEIVFMFPGQGTQYPNMGANFYEDEAVFRETVDHCSEMLMPLLGRDLREILYRADNAPESSEELLRRTCFQQPAIFTIEYALAKLLQSWGILPTAMIGHSIGEYVAACIAEVFSVKDALMLVAARGRMMQDLPGGKMLSVRLPEDELTRRLDSEIAIAAVNGPSLCVASGPSLAISVLQQKLESEGVICRQLHTSHAFHSPMIDPIMEQFADCFKNLSLAPPKLPFVSTVTTRWITPEEATDPGYWARHMREPVRFAEGIQTIWEKPDRVLLEVGPRTTMATLARQQVKDVGKQVVISSLPDSSSNQAEWRAILDAMGQLWLCGVPIEWPGFFGSERRNRIGLPTYPFERKRFWVEPNLHMLPGVAVEEPVGESCEDSAKDVLRVGGEKDSEEGTFITNLKGLIEDYSGLDLNDAGESMTFVEMGIDSLFLTQMIGLLRKRFGVEILFKQLQEELSTLRTLADYIQKESTATTFSKGFGAPIHFGESGRQLFGIYYPPGSRAAREEGVLLCYPIVQEYMRTHWTFRQISGLLSRAGFHVLRFDYYGTGDSAGEGLESKASHWKRDIRSAVAALKNIAGVREVSLVGLRLGASLAAEVAAEDLEVKSLVLWDPVVKGLNHIEELVGMHQELYGIFPTARDELRTAGVNELLGYPLCDEARNEIKQINLLDLSPCRAERIVVVVSEETSDYVRLRDHLNGTGIAVEYQVIQDASYWGRITMFYERLNVDKIPRAIAGILSRNAKC
jgi:acyl transferase domain-containing protein